MNNAPSLRNQIRNFFSHPRNYIVAVYAWGTLILFIGYSGAMTELTCGWDKPGAAVNCIKQTIIYWSVRFGEEEIRDLRGAHMVRGSSAECDDCARVELLTANGDIPLTNTYTASTSSEDAVAKRINDFVKNLSVKQLYVIEPGLLSPGVSILLLIVLGCWYIWHKTKAQWRDE
jgi:hypothetical protein